MAMAGASRDGHAAGGAAGRSTEASSSRRQGCHGGPALGGRCRQPPRKVPARHPPCAAGPAHGRQPVARTATPCRRAASCATSITGAATPTPRSCSSWSRPTSRSAPTAICCKTRAYTPEERAVMQKRLVAADGRPAAAGQLHARRSGQRALHPDQGLGLRPRPRGRPQCLRGGADLLPRRHHHHRAPARRAEGLHALEGGAASRCSSACSCCSSSSPSTCACAR